MKPTAIITTFIIILLIGFMVFYGQTSLSSTFNNVKIFLASFSFEGKCEDCESLIQENKYLKFELQKHRNSSADESEGKIAKVFSRYPFNDREYIVVNLGKNDGIKIDSPVLTPSKYLLGKVVSVYDNQSEIETIFNPEWKSSVALKVPEIKAVLKGGQVPKLELISKDSEIKEGDFVFNISPDFPYEKLIGEVKNIKKNPEETWHTALVEVPYSIDEITEVIILNEFK